MPCVFVVDDDRTTSRLLMTLLEIEGYQVQVQAQPAKVLSMTQSSRPDAFIIDCLLADMDGIALLRAIRAEPTLSGVPVIMISGLDRHDDCLRAGANTFLLKPFRPDELIQALRRLLSAAATG